ncbi:hypothetical protein HMPREF9606_02279 [Cutibacterium acnes HL036PA3]|nr:hypothetical protein HMPREF9605_01622 [Cutibacterium acnes HL036PA2]EFS88690.1 hypothetical protein HMPREF9606_02279 [Cutibacterium acnes HL036PA3]EFT57945.1 hypothetical protein HMPREF9615_01593 [Cutibacterium acnes HL002PA3]
MSRGPQLCELLGPVRATWRILTALARGWGRRVFRVGRLLNEWGQPRTNPEFKHDIGP